MGKAAEIQILKEYEPDIIKQCRELDKQVYPAEYLKDFDLESALICKNPRSRIVVWYQGKLIAYYEYLPLTPAAFDTFLHTHDTVFDLLIKEPFISPWIKGKPVDFYVGSIVVSPDHQGKMISLVLMRGFYLALRELESEGYGLGRMGGTGVSSGGVYSLKTFLNFETGHEVPGGMAMYGDSKRATQCLEEYVGF